MIMLQVGDLKILSFFFPAIMQVAVYFSWHVIFQLSLEIKRGSCRYTTGAPVHDSVYGLSQKLDRPSKQYRGFSIFSITYALL